MTIGFTIQSVCTQIDKITNPVRQVTENIRKYGHLKDKNIEKICQFSTTFQRNAPEISFMGVHAMMASANIQAIFKKLITHQSHQSHQSHPHPQSPLQFYGQDWGMWDTWGRNMWDSGNSGNSDWGDTWDQAYRIASLNFNTQSKYKGKKYKSMKYRKFTANIPAIMNLATPVNVGFSQQTGSAELGLSSAELGSVGLGLGLKRSAKLATMNTGLWVNFPKTKKAFTSLGQDYNNMPLKRGRVSALAYITAKQTLRNDVRNKVTNKVTNKMAIEPHKILWANYPLMANTPVGITSVFRWVGWVAKLLARSYATGKYTSLPSVPAYTLNPIPPVPPISPFPSFPPSPPIAPPFPPSVPVPPTVMPQSFQSPTAQSPSATSPQSPLVVNPNVRLNTLHTQAISGKIGVRFENAPKGMLTSASSTGPLQISITSAENE